MQAKTPLLRQYFETKEEHPGVLLAMRVGDFYEFYGPDAEAAAAALEITLTGREDGDNGRVAMAGVPFHSVEKYLARLLAQGIKVALCDQVEDPKLAKGLVKRAVTRVLTPGTLVEDSMLDSGANCFLSAVVASGDTAAVATLDPSTGEFMVTEVTGEMALERALQELARLRPAEVLLTPGTEPISELVRCGLSAAVTQVDTVPADRAERKLVRLLGVKSLASMGCADLPIAQQAAACVVDYAEKNGLPLGHIDGLSTYSVDGFMKLDLATRRSLELTANLSDGSRRYTLLAVLDLTRTAMGSRLIRRWIDQPLLDRDALNGRLDAVDAFLHRGIERGDLREQLRGIADIERLVARCATGLAHPRDLGGLRFSLAKLPELADGLAEVVSPRIRSLIQQFGDHRELSIMLERAIVAEPPATLRDGGLIREGYDLELDKLRLLSRDGKSYIAKLEQSERQATGISTLKVGYNAVFGYFLEAPKAQASKVPAHYIRKQTTANAERYITAELKDHESAVLGANEKSLSLELELFDRIRRRVAECSKELLATARAIAELDVLASLAEVAATRGFSRPTLSDDDRLEIRGGRHAVVEAHGSSFVPNDTSLGGSGPALVILTGPNMSGKSTYLRQNALIVLMAQIGSFVPARACEVGLCDRIFARIGAKDELALGQSTFMVEMVESAHILHHATERSLVILDEIGRGTSTYDGLAIAWAMAERLAEIGAKTLFATHYHQLNTLASEMPRVENYRVTVEEVGDEVIWTHRVVPGGTDRSYGIQVAKMAGVPAPVLRRASEVLRELERTEAPQPARLSRRSLQLTLFDVEEPEVLRALEGLQVDALTPLQALALLDEWKRRFARKA